MDLLDDPKLLRAFKAGEPHALEKVYRLYVPWVARLVRTGLNVAGGGRVGLNNQADVEDVLQDVFHKLLSPKGRQNYDGLRPYSGLVRAVTRSSLVDHLRRQRRHPAPTQADEDVLDKALDQAALGQNTLNPDESLLVKQFMETCTAEERRLLTLRFEECVSQRDASDALGLSRQTIRTLETRIRERFEAFVRERGALETPA